MITSPSRSPRSSLRRASGPFCAELIQEPAMRSFEWAS